MTKNRLSINQQILILIVICLLALVFSVVINPSKDNANHSKQLNSFVERSVPKDVQNNINIGNSIAHLTEETHIIDYLVKHRTLPNYYITKRQARVHGWNAKAGNLCEVLPGRAIGGDIFADREEMLPIDYKRTWFEADINYSCGIRGADRIIYSDDGLIYVTHDHYQTFQIVN